MSDPLEALILDFLEWIGPEPRPYAEVMEAWRTSCPRLSIWEDACLEGLIAHEAETGRVILSDAGKAFLLRYAR